MCILVYDFFWRGLSTKGPFFIIFCYTDETVILYTLLKRFWKVEIVVLLRHKRIETLICYERNEIVKAEVCIFCYHIWIKVVCRYVRVIVLYIYSVRLRSEVVRLKKSLAKVRVL